MKTPFKATIINNKEKKTDATAIPDLPVENKIDLMRMNTTDHLFDVFI